MQLLETIKDLDIMHFAESDIFWSVVICLSILIVMVLALIYKKRRKEMKAMKRRRRMMTARLNKLVEGQDQKEIIKKQQTAL